MTQLPRKIFAISDRASMYSDVETRYVFVHSYHANGTSSTGMSQDDFIAMLLEVFVYSKDIKLESLRDDGKPCDEDWEDKPDGCSGTMALEDVTTGDAVTGHTWVCNKCEREAEYEPPDLYD